MDIDFLNQLYFKLSTVSITDFYVLEILDNILYIWWFRWSNQSDK